MPTYEYRCSTCGTPFEQRRSIADDAGDAPRCPQGHADVRRVFSVFASASGRGGAEPSGGGGGCCGGACGCG